MKRKKVDEFQLIWKADFVPKIKTDIQKLIELNERKKRLPAKRPYFWNIRSTSVFEHWNVFKFPTNTREFTACGSCEFVWFDNFDIFIMDTF